MFVLRRIPDGAFVQDMRLARDGRSYTRDLLRAKKFASREEAERDRCPENERVVCVEQLLKGGG